MNLTKDVVLITVIYLFISNNFLTERGWCYILRCMLRMYSLSTYVQYFFQYDLPEYFTSVSCLLVAVSYFVS